MVICFVSGIETNLGDLNVNGRVILMLPSKLVHAITLLTCILEVSGSWPSRDTDRFCGFIQSRRDTCPDGTLFGPLPHPSTSVCIHCLRSTDRLIFGGGVRA